MKTSELTGPALDWAVAKAEGMQLKKFEKRGPWYYAEEDGVYRFIVGHTYTPSTNWAQGGPIIDRECISVGPQQIEGKVVGFCALGLITDWSYGSTCLIAAMRCFVASKLGEEVDIPAELKD